MEKLVSQGHDPKGRRRSRSPTRWEDSTKQLLDNSVTRAIELTSSQHVRQDIETMIMNKEKGELDLCVLERALTRSS